MKILVIEDEPSLAKTIVRILTESTWTAEWAADGGQGFDLAKNGGFSLVILDILLPGMDGWQVCSELRAARVNVPILMLTAMDQVEDRVKGLNLGADDYLPKPFQAQELVARVNALLRRDKTQKGLEITVGDRSIDRRKMQVSRGGSEITLTRREYDLLVVLAENEGRVLTREAIQRLAWNDPDAYSNTVEVHISALRRKLDAPFPKRLIHTVYGFGYMLRAHE